MIRSIKPFMILYVKDDQKQEPQLQCLIFQTLKDISWYTERPIHQISLGGLLILVVIRTITFNMTKMRVNTRVGSYPRAGQ